ncbi:MAG: MarC family protein [Bacteroidaceae bacterium]|nr:MarC family protein [Candidatus Colenecus caballi]MCQ2072838.1 MarC family protein [Bacteroidaceae bacterium]
MGIDFKEIAGAFVVLFAILDITGSIPIIIDLQHKTGKVPAFKVSLISWVLLTIIYFLGDGVLALFGVDIESFAVAGSLVIIAIGFEMTFDITIFKYDASPKGVSTIVPLVFPLIVGAGSFTTLLSLKAEFAAINIMIALFLNIVFIFFVLKSIDWIERVLGQGFIYVLRKFFGIILLAIAVKLFTSNIGHLVG